MNQFPNLYKLLLVFILGCFQSYSQPSLYRQFTPSISVLPQNQTGFFFGAAEAPIPTSDGGFLIVNRKYNLGFESPGGLIASVIIKTDSALQPQWQKDYFNACVLPTGGIILFGVQGIEKVTNAGLTVWTRSLNTAWVLNDALSYDSIVRFVGNQTVIQLIPNTISSYYISDGLTLTLDTNGTYLSHQLFESLNTASYGFRASAIFSRIKRDAQGNFFVFSNWQFPSRVSSQMAIAKFDTAFNFTWAKTGAGSLGAITFDDIDILPNGRIMASGRALGLSPLNYTYKSAFFKLTSNGTIVQEKYFPVREYSSGLCRLSNNNYIATAFKYDSLFMFEIDTALNLQWHNYRARSSCAAGTVLQNGQLVSSIIYKNNSSVFTSSIAGQSCASLPIPVAFTTASLTLQDFTLTPVASSVSVVSTSASPTFSVGYQDTCLCTPYISITNVNICAGSSATVNVQSSGGLAWYAAPTGGTPLFTGSQYSVSSSTPTNITYYLDNLICTNNSPRVPVTVNIYAPPSLTFSPANPTVCAGGSVSVTASGALYYTWPNTTNQTSVNALTATSSVIYTITGAVNAGCTDSKTIQVNVVPLQTVTITGPSSVCVGVPATYSAFGGQSYSWSASAYFSLPNPIGTGSTAVLTPTVTTNNKIYVTVAATPSACANTVEKSLVTYNVPNLSASATPSAICATTSITLNATGANSYTWTNIGIGATQTAVVNSTGSFVVQGSNPGCTASDTAIVQLFALPQLTLSPSIVTICSGSTVPITASGALYYIWPNTTNQTSVNALTATSSVIYTVTGAVNAGCTDSKTIQVNVVPLQTVTITGPSSVCIGVPASYTVSGGQTYSWSASTFFSPPYPIGTGSVAMLTPTVTTNNKIYVTVAATPSTCANTVEKSLVVYNVPVLNAWASPSIVCANATTTLNAMGADTYTWANIGVGATQTTAVNGAGSFSVQGSNPGCTASSTVLIQLLPVPQLTLSPASLTICNGDSASFTAYGATSYTWNNTLVDTTFSSIWPLGTHTLQVTGSKGLCTAQSTASIQVNAQPTIGIWSQWPYLCAGKTRTLVAYGAASYTWSNGSINDSTIVAGISDTVITVLGMANGCLDIDTLSLEVKPNPTVTAVASTSSVCQYEKVELYAYGAQSLGWTYPGTGSLSVIYPFNSMTLTAIGQNSFGCFDSTQVFIDVKTRPVIVAYPNSVTRCKGDMVVLTAQGAVTYTWNNTLNGDTVFVYPGANQAYTVIGTGTNGCTGSTIASVLLKDCLGFQESKRSKTSIEIYPNPSSGIFYLNYIDNTSAKPLLVFSADGRLLLRLPANAITFDLSDYAAGLYVVKEENGLGSWKIVRGWSGR